jgi:hypothetical protein
MAHLELEDYHTFTFTNDEQDGVEIFMSAPNVISAEGALDIGNAIAPLLADMTNHGTNWRVHTITRAYPGEESIYQEA